MQVEAVSPGGAVRGFLAGLRVLKLGEDITSSFCARLLADVGADVLKVEPPGGDPARAGPPRAGGANDRERGSWFLYLNAGKRSAVLDPAGAGCRLRLHALTRAAGVLVENLHPADLLRCPHLSEHDLWVDVEHPAAGRLRMPGAGYRASCTPARVGGPAPLLGRHVAPIGDWTAAGATARARRGRTPRRPRSASPRAAGLPGPRTSRPGWDRHVSKQTWCLQAVDKRAGGNRHEDRLDGAQLRPLVARRRDLRHL